MQANTKQCTVNLPIELLQQASDRGILVKTDGGRYFGLSRIVADSLAQKLKGAA